MKFTRLVSLSAGIALIATGLAMVGALFAQTLRPDQAAARPRSKFAPGFGALPLSFEANRGQTDSQVEFIAQGRGYELFLRDGEAALLLQNRRAGAPKSEPFRALPLPMKLQGANATGRGLGLEELPGKKSYFVGSDPMKWQRNISLFGKVKYPQVYKGVDLVYYGTSGSSNMTSSSLPEPTCSRSGSSLRARRSCG